MDALWGTVLGEDKERRDLAPTHWYVGERVTRPVRGSQLELMNPYVPSQIMISILGLKGTSTLQPNLCPSSKVGVLSYS
eukprot:388591-Rhodomonas_salina.4